MQALATGLYKQLTRNENTYVCSSGESYGDFEGGTRLYRYVGTTRGIRLSVPHGLGLSAVQIQRRLVRKLNVRSCVLSMV